MEIRQVEFSRLTCPTGDGVRVIISYDYEPAYDLFDVYGEPDTSMVLNMIHAQPDPEHLLLALRRITNVTVH